MVDQTNSEKKGFNYSMLPKQKSFEILVRFQAVGDNYPGLKQTALVLDSTLSLSDVRSLLGHTFSTCFGRNFIFLSKGKEVLNEQALKLINILPKPPHGVPKSQFRFKNTQYKKFQHTVDGMTTSTTCAGIVFLKEAGNQWFVNEQQLYGFSFIPATLLSTDKHIHEHHVEKINQFAAMGELHELLMLFDNLSSGTCMSELYDQRQATPLHYASSNGHLEVCEFLVGRLGREALFRTDINLKTPLHCALTRCHMDIVLYLLQLSPDLKCRDILGQSCDYLIYSLNEVRSNILMNGIEVSILDDQTVLHLTCIAIQKRNIPVARKLCQIIKVFPATFYKPPLHLAAELGDKEMVESLVNKIGGSDKDVIRYSHLEYDTDGHLPLHYACQHGHSDIIHLLYSDVLIDKDFDKATRLSVNWKQYEVLLRLSELRSEFQVNVEMQHVLLHEAESSILFNGKFIVPVLKSNDYAMQRIASEAARKNCIDIMELLVALGIHVDKQDSMGRTPLHEAVENGHIYMVQFLLKQDINCNIQDWQGSTPLHYACRTGKVDVVDSLLAHPSLSSNLSDHCGRNVILVAAYSGRTQVVKRLLRETTINAWQVDKYDQGILHYLIQLDIQEVHLILDHLKNRSGRQCLSLQNNIVAKKKICRRRKPKTIAYECGVCGKKWHCFSWHNKFSHMCLNGGKKMVFRKINLSKESDLKSLRVVSHTFTNVSYEEIVLSAVKMHIVANRTKYLQQLLDLVFPWLSVTSLKYLCGVAANYWCIEFLDILRSIVVISNCLLSELLSIAVLTESWTSAMKQKKFQMVKNLLSLGACPNYYRTSSSDDQDAIRWNPGDNMHNIDNNEVSNNHIKTAKLNSNADIKVILGSLSLTKHEQKHSVCIPLENAVIQTDLQLARLLLDHGASPRICFALHLSIIGRDVSITELILNYWNSQDDIFHLGFDNIVDSYKLCSDPSGVLQALCVNSCRIDTLKCVLAIFPLLLKSNHVLTTTAIKSIRPEMFKHADLKIHQVFYQNSSGSSVHHLPLTNILEWNKFSCNSSNAEDVFQFIIKRDPHVSCVQTINGINIHAACEMFARAVQKRLWIDCELLLVEWGTIIWKCLLSNLSDCHKLVYDCYSQDLILCSPTIQGLITRATLKCVHTFFSSGQDVLSYLDNNALQSLSSQINSISTISGHVDPSELLDKIAVGNLEIIRKRPEGLYACAKTLLVRPAILSYVVKWRFDTKNSYLQMVLNPIKSEMIRSNRSILNIVHFVHSRCPEVNLMRIISNLTKSEIHYIIQQKYSLAHLGCIFGVLEIVKACFSAQNQIPISDTFNTSLLDASAAFGHKDIMDYLIGNCAKIQPSTLRSVLTRRSLVGVPLWDSGLKNGLQEIQMLHIIEWLLKRKNVVIPHKQDCYGILLETSIGLSYWKITSWCLHNCDYSQISFCNPSATLVSVIAHGPVAICLTLLKQMNFPWSRLSQEKANSILYVAAFRNDPVTDYVMESMLSSFKFSEFQYLLKRDDHNRNILHFISAQGRREMINMILMQLKDCELNQIHDILNFPDSSMATPLWYALSFQHWDIAKLLMLNGAVLHSLRSVPNLFTIRTYAVQKIVEFKKQQNEKAIVPFSQSKRNTSLDIAASVGSNEVFFREMYDENITVHNSYFEQWVVSTPDIPKYKLPGEIRYLARLMYLATRKNTSLLHIAIGLGHSQLASTILQQPLSEFCSNKGHVSPLVFVIINNRREMVELCKRFPISRHLASCIVHHALININLSAVTTLIAETVTTFSLGTETSDDINKLLGKVKSTLHHTDPVSMASHIQVMQNITIKELLELIKDNPSCKSELLSEFFVFLSTFLGKPDLFDMIRTTCSSISEYYGTMTRGLVAGFHAIDMLFILSPKDKSSQIAKRNIDARIQCLHGFMDKVNLHDKTLFIIREKRLFNLLMPLLEEGVIYPSEKQREQWLSILEEASELGYTAFALLLLKQFHHDAKFIQTCHRIAGISALRRNKTILNYILDCDIKLDYFLRIPNICKISNKANISILECLIISNDVTSVEYILSGLHTRVDEQTLKCLVELSYFTGNKAIVTRVETFATQISRNIMTDDFSFKLFELAVNRGHEQLCLSFAKRIYLDMKSLAKLRISNLHYACIYGMSELVEQLISSTPNDVNDTSYEGFTALDCTRAFGHVDLSLELMQKYQARSSQDIKCTSVCGWFKHNLLTNERRENKVSIEYGYTSRIRQPMTLITLFKLGDDKGIASFLITAQESIVAIMEQDYQSSPLLHLCVKHACVESLRILLELLEKHSTEGGNAWLTLEYRGKIPIVLAIECANVEIVYMLRCVNVNATWRHQNGESILHFVARSGNYSIASALTENMNIDCLDVKDSCGLTPAATAVAFGNQHILHILHREYTKRGSHVDHIHTNFTCLECLLDYCIGWHRHVHSQQVISPIILVRDVRSRNKSLSGYREHRRGKNRLFRHPLKTLLKWFVISQNDDMVKSALKVMGYPGEPVIAHLFLLLSKFGDQGNIMKIALKRQMSNVAIYLMQNGYQMSNIEANHVAVDSVGRHMNDVFRNLLNLNKVDLFVKGYDNCSALDAAFAMGNKAIIAKYERTLDSSQRWSSLHVMHDVFDILTPRIRYRMKPDRFPNIGKVKSSDRTSPMDIIRILPTQTLIEIYAHLNIDDNGLVVFPTKILDKPVNIDASMIQINAMDLKITEIEVISILYSKLVIGRYTSEINKANYFWKTLKNICIRSHTSSMPDGVSMLLQDGVLYDNVRIAVNKETHRMYVHTADLPVELVDQIDYRRFVDDNIITEIKEHISRCIPGLSIDVRVDWLSIDEIKDQQYKDLIIKSLAATTSENPLIKLKETFTHSGELLKDISLMLNKATGERIIHLLKPVSSIIIRYMPREVLSQDPFSFKLNETMYWNFHKNIENTQFVSLCLPLMSVVEVCHSACVCFAEGIGKLSKAPSTLNNKKQNKGSRIKLNIDWYSFCKSNSADEIFAMFGGCLSLQMSKLGSVYASLPYLDLHIDELVFRYSSTPESAGIEYQSNILTVMVYVYKDQTAVWTSTDIDYSGALVELQANQLMTVWNSKGVSKLRKQFDQAVEKLQESVGGDVLITYPQEEFLQYICKSCYTYMTHPFKQLTFQMNYVSKFLKISYANQLLTKLESSNFCWKIGGCNVVDPGIWCWLTFKEFESLASTALVLTIFARKTNLRRYGNYKVLTKERVTSLSKTKPVLFWVHSTSLQNLDINWRNRIQMLTFTGNVFYVSDSDKAANIFDGLQRSFGFEICTDIQCQPQQIIKEYSALSKTVVDFNNSLRSQKTFLTPQYLCWQRLLKMGYNFAIEVDEEQSLNSMTVFKLFDAIDYLETDQCFNSDYSNMNGTVVFWLQTTNTDESIDKLSVQQIKGDWFMINSPIKKDDIGCLLEKADDNLTEEYDDCDIPFVKTKVKSTNWKKCKIYITRTIPSKVTRIFSKRRANSRTRVTNASKKLLQAARNGNIETIHRLLDFGADINTKDSNGCTPLILAAMAFRHVVQKLLLTRGADIQLVNKEHRSALHYAATNGNPRSMMVLITSGAKIDQKDKYGWTPLRCAINSRQKPAANILVFCGADCTVNDKKGESPATLCKKKHFGSLMKESMDVVHGRQQDCITLDFEVLETGRIYQLPKIDLSLKIPLALGSGSIEFIGRRVQPKYGKTILLEASNEIFLSDIYEYMWSGVTLKEPAILTFPVYSKADDIYLKTKNGICKGCVPEIIVQEERLVCRVAIHISELKAFVLAKRISSDSNEPIMDQHIGRIDQVSYHQGGLPFVKNENVTDPSKIYSVSHDGKHTDPRFYQLQGGCYELYPVLARIILKFSQKSSQEGQWKAIPMTSHNENEVRETSITSDNQESISFKGVMDYNLMLQLSRNLGSVWRNFALRLGFTTKSVDNIEYRVGTGASNMAIEMLESWRKSRRHHGDEGMQELLTVLELTGNFELIEIVLNSLRIWLESNPDIEKRFYSWLSKFYFTEQPNTESTKL